MPVSQMRRVQGVPVPSFFYGTAWKEERTEELVTRALAAGFRAIDTANQRRHYFEAGVGEAVTKALDQGRLTRADLFLQTKFTLLDDQDHRLPYDANADVTNQVHQSLESSLEHLRTASIDSLILHGPSGDSGLADEDWRAWGAMEALQKAGSTRLIGVSNISLNQLTALHEHATVKPAFVQNRCYARTGWDRAVRSFCDTHAIAYQGFSLLTANARELQAPAIREIAKRAGRTVPQVAFRFALQLGMVPLTGTTSAGHMREDLATFDFELADEDVNTLERCGT